jgi:hypothetical protein
MKLFLNTTGLHNNGDDVPQKLVETYCWVSVEPIYIFKTNLMLIINDEQSSALALGRKLTLAAHFFERSSIRRLPSVK